MKTRRVLVAGCFFALVAGASLAALALRSGGEEPTTDAPQSSDRPPTSAVPTTTTESTGPIRFVLADRYAVGERVDVLIENVGTRPYLFQAYYQACFLRYSDSSGRRFIIPPGTHCDLLAEEPIRPGERKKLFTWRLDECVKDRWGCVKSRALPPGTYTIKGRFEPRADGETARASTTFTIVPA